MSPTVLRAGGFRFFFFSREETRAHVHVQHADGEAKFWLEPRVELAQNFNFRQHQINAALALIIAHEEEIRRAWRNHFGR